MAAALLMFAAPAANAQRVNTASELKKLEKVLKKDAFEVVVDLHLGKHESSIYTCDFSLDYVHINADYTT